jgi:hypothetical protein
MRLLADALDPAGRWSSARGGLFAPDNWLVFLLAIGGMLAAAGGAWVWWALRTRRRNWEQFERQLRATGLAGDQRTVALHLVELGGLKDPRTLFERETFEGAEKALLASARFAACSNEVQNAFRAVLRRIREKLAFVGTSYSTAPTSRQILTGSTVELQLDLTGASIEARVETVTDSRLVLTALGPVGAEEGSSVVVRYAIEGSVWEFDTVIVAATDEQLYLDHCESVRVLNRRRFPRIPVDMEANIASLPFVAMEEPVHLPELRPARLVELAGPGFIVETIDEFCAQERVLVVVKVREGRFIEGVGKVLRVVPQPGNRQHVAMEMMGLNDDEIAELTRETNLAARRNAKPFRTDEPEPVTNELDGVL